MRDGLLFVCYGNCMDAEELIDKWNDALACAEEYLEKNLISEFLEDLKDIRG